MKRQSPNKRLPSWSERRPDPPNKLVSNCKLAYRINRYALFNSFIKGGHCDMADGDGGTGSNAVWAVALIIIVALIIGAVFYSGILTKKKEVDINVTAPSH